MTLLLNIIIGFSANAFTNRAQRIQNLAYALIQAGVTPGDRVAVIAPNTYELSHALVVLRVADLSLKDP